VAGRVDAGWLAIVQIRIGAEGCRCPFTRGNDRLLERAVGNITSGKYTGIRSLGFFVGDHLIKTVQLDEFFDEAAVHNKTNFYKNAVYGNISLFFRIIDVADP